MKYSITKLLIYISLLLSLCSCLRFDIEHIMLTLGIPTSLNCNFIDEHGNDIVKDIVEKNGDILFNENGINNIVKSDYYSLKLIINGVSIPTQELKITDNTGSHVINPMTGKETGYTIFLGWENLFTDELLKSKWRDFEIEYYIIFPKLFQDNNEHLLKCKIKRGGNGSPIITDLFFDKKPVTSSNSANFCFIILN